MTKIIRPAHGAPVGRSLEAGRKYGSTKSHEIMGSKMAVVTQEDA